MDGSSDLPGEKSAASTDGATTTGPAGNAPAAKTEDGGQGAVKPVSAHAESPPNPQASLPPDEPAAPAAAQGVSSAGLTQDQLTSAITSAPQILLTDEAYKKAIMLPKTQAGSYVAALVLTGSIVPLPIIGAILTATVYITRPGWIVVIPPPLGPVTLPTNLLVVLVSLGITLVLWLLASLPFISFTAFDNANPQSSNHLKRHLLGLRSCLMLLIGTFDQSSGRVFADGSGLISFRNKTAEDYDLALRNAVECLAAANNQLEGGDLSWIMGIGYLKTWNFVHRAEEAMVDIAPREFVIREALHDESAIDGSNIASRDYVLSNLKTAVRLLSPSAAAYLKSLPVQDRNALPSNLQNQAKLPEPLDPVGEMEARNALRDAKQTLNEFRANIWDGLVRLRNLLVGTALITGLLTYVLLCVAISVDVRAESLKAAIVFYLVGAIVGLFSRLYTESQSDNAIDDYGLTVIRVVITLVISGLAAVAGVLVVALLSLNLLNAPATAPPTTGLPTLQNVYDLVQNRQGIILAALFGLTPNLFINVLQHKADDARAQLKNSTAPGQGN